MVFRLFPRATGLLVAITVVLMTSCGWESEKGINPLKSLRLYFCGLDRREQCNSLELLTFCLTPSDLGIVQVVDQTAEHSRDFFEL